MADRPAPKVLVRSEQTGGRLAVIESTMLPGAPGPPLHMHEFDETFCVLDGELTIQIGEELIGVVAGEAAFAPGGCAHTLANRGDAPARFLILCAPAGFEREFARRAAAIAGTDAPAWAMQRIPEITVLGPRIGDGTNSG